MFEYVRHQHGMVCADTVRAAPASVVCSGKTVNRCQLGNGVERVERVYQRSSERRP